MSKAEDPYYSRKPVPTEFIENVGETGLTPQEEFINRERKYSTANGGDVRKFSNPGSTSSKGEKSKDPYYQRKAVPLSMISGVGESGLTPEEEFLNRERKYSLTGIDVRKFSNGPAGDPYYKRAAVTKPQIVGVGETGQTPAQEFEVRERKQSMFQLGTDPFAELTGSGHRGSIVGPGYVDTANTARRKSSALAPHAMKAAAAHHAANGEQLAPIASRADEDGPTPIPNGAEAPAPAPVAAPAAAPAATSDATKLYDQAAGEHQDVGPMGEKH